MTVTVGGGISCSTLPSVERQQRSFIGDGDGRGGDRSRSEKLVSSGSALSDIFAVSITTDQALSFL